MSGQATATFFRRGVRGTMRAFGGNVRINLGERVGVKMEASKEAIRREERRKRAEAEMRELDAGKARVAAEAAARRAMLELARTERARKRLKRLVAVLVAGLVALALALLAENTK